VISVRLERPGDASDIRETNELAFGGPLEARLVDALRDSLRGTQDYLSLVATIDRRVVGHILFTPITIEPARNCPIAGLAPMAVRPEHQRSGIGGQLIRAGLKECRRSGYSAVVVLGHPEYYPRFGFVPAHTFGLTCEFPSPPEAFMAIELESEALNGVRGVVRYRPEFSSAEA
jgi:putative acetyltransferase